MSYSGKKGWTTKPKPGVQVDWLHPLSRALAGCWLFNEGGGSVAQDISGNRNHGTLTNMEPPTDWVGSSHGGALDFDGVNDYVDCGTDPRLHVQSHTVAAWIRPSITPAGNDTYIFFSVSDTIVTSGVEWAVRGQRLAYAYNDGAIRGWYTKDHTFTAGVDYHVAGVWDSSVGTVTFYYNGIEDDPVATTQGTVQYVGDTARIGYQPNNLYWPGLIGEVRVWNGILSGQQIKQLYHDPFCGLLRVPIRRYFLEVAVVGQPMQLRGTTVPHLRQWHPRIP